MNLKLDRAIVFFDLETTGINVALDRIVEISVVKIFPDYTEEVKKRLVNPEIHIPEEAIAIHGISNEDVSDAPLFKHVAKSFFEFLNDCDLGGFNILRFDIPVLTEEFRRCGLTFSAKGRKVIDVQRIYHKKEPRTLSAALQFYCGEEHTDAHGSEEDARATMRVLEAQLAKYDDLPTTVAELEQYANPKDPTFVDGSGKLRWRNGEVTIGFGQKSGTSLRTLADKDPGYLKWIIRGNFEHEVKEIVRDALGGTFLEKKEKNDSG